MGFVLAAHELDLDLSKAVIELDKKRITFTGAGGTKRIVPIDGQGQFLIDWALRGEDKRLTMNNALLQSGVPGFRLV